MITQWKRTADLRERMSTHAEGLSPVFLAVDRLREAGAALVGYPEWVATAVIVLVIARPRRLWRWSRRAIIGWRLWIGLRELLPARPVRDR